MDTVSRLIAFTLFAVLAPAAFGWGVVSQTSAGEKYWFTTSTNGAVNATRGATAVQACNARAAALEAADSAREYSVTQCDGTTTVCTIVERSRATGAVLTADVCGKVASNTYAAGSCPSFSVAVGAQCACQAGYAPNSAGTQCVLPDTSECASRRDSDGSSGGQDFEMAVWNRRTTACSGGCVVRGSFAAGQTGGSGTIYNAKATGETCDPSASSGSGDTSQGSDVSAAPLPLEPGQCSGTVNGTPVVVPCGAGTTTKTESKSTIQNGDGTKVTTEKSTECVDGAGCKTTTTTTTTSASGTQTGKTVVVKDGFDTQDKDTPAGAASPSSPASAAQAPDPLCEQFPDIPACKVSSADTSCSAGVGSVSCDGDAVQCAMLRDQFLRHCAFFDKATDESGVAEAAKTSGTGGASDHPNRSPETHSLSTFDQTNLIGGSCPGDRVLGSGSVHVTLPFSQLCGPASTLGMILVGITALSCIAIVFKGS